MPTSASVITSGTDGSDQFYGGATYGKYETASVPLVAGRLYFLCFQARSRFGTGDLGPDPTQTGANWDLVTWERFDTVIGNENAAMYVWRCQPAATVSSAVITIPTPGVYDAFQLWNHGQWHLIEFTGVADASASNGADLIGRTDVGETNGTPATSISQAFGVPFVNGGSGSFCAVGTSESGGAITPAAGYSELADTTTETDRLETSFTADATSPFGGSWSSSVNAGTIGIEVRGTYARWYLGKVGWSG